MMLVRFVKQTGAGRLASPLALAIVVSLVVVACAGHNLSSTEDEPVMIQNQQKAPVTYVALGDSTGSGVGAREGGYVARLFHRIERERPASKLINLCVSGATTQDLLRGQIEPALAARPTLLTIGIGVNDIHRGTTPEAFARNYEEIVTRLRAKTDAPIVVTNLPDMSLAPAVPLQFRDEVHRRINLFNERIKQIAAEHGLRLVDAYTVTRDVIPNHPEFFSADNFHPSDPGYEYWAKTMWPTVKSVIDE